MVKISFDLNGPKDSLNTDKGVQNGRNPKSLTLEIYHGGCFTPTPSRSYIGGHVSSINVADIAEFCLHDLQDMNVDADVLEMTKYVKDYKIILVYVEHGSSVVPLMNRIYYLRKAVQSSQQWHLISSGSENFLHWQWELLLTVRTP
nr:hypothetical protein [Tanacetum cinerariifolium]